MTKNIAEDPITSPKSNTPVSATYKERSAAYKERSVDAEFLPRFMRDFGMKQGELAEILGISSGTIPNWIKQGIAPKAMRLAVEALRRRAGENQPIEEGPTHRTILVKVPEDREEALRTVLQAMHIPHQNIEL